jgi:hypothetical protein
VILIHIIGAVASLSNISVDHVAKLKSFVRIMLTCH